MHVALKSAAESLSPLIDLGFATSFDRQASSRIVLLGDFSYGTSESAAPAPPPPAAPSSIAEARRMNLDNPPCDRSKWPRA